MKTILRQIYEMKVLDCVKAGKEKEDFYRHFYAAIIVHTRMEDSPVKPYLRKELAEIALDIILSDEQATETLIQMAYKLAEEQ